MLELFIAKDYEELAVWDILVEMMRSKQVLLRKVIIFSKDNAKYVFKQEILGKCLNF